MSYYPRCVYRQSPFEKVKEALPVVAIGLVVVLAIAWVIAEFACTRSFVGRLSSKHTEVDYKDNRKHPDGEGGFHGENSTVAYIDYKLLFYVEGSLRPVSAGKFSAKINRRHAEEEAYDRLMSEHVEPALYTHTQKELTYLVTVKGWLLDGTLVDAVNVDTLPAEK